MSRFQRVLLLVGVLALPLAGLAVLGHRSSSSRRLQEYKAALLSKGEKLTYAALTVSRATNRSNSFGILTNATNRLRGAKLNASWLNVRQYIGPGQARARCLAATDGSAGRNAEAPWSEMAQELAVIEAPLADLRQAMKDPQPDWNAAPFTGMPNFIAIRSAAQWLSIDALSQCHDNRLEEGLEDIEAMIGLARLNRDEYTLVAQMIRVAVTGLGLATTWEALQVPGWTEPQLSRLQAAWQQVDLAEALEKGIAGDRGKGEELWSTLRQTNGLQTSSSLLARPLLGSPGPTSSVADFFCERIYFPVYLMTSIDDDELLYLKVMQGCLDSIRSLRAGGSWPKASRDLERILGPLLEVTRSLERYRFPFSSIAVPNFLKAMATGARAETERQLTVAAIALKRFQLLHGEAPRTLDALTPDYLPTLPRDLMSGQTLRYKMDTGGSAKLYSVGTDGEDNGGDASSAQAGKFGLWEGRDAVWPAAPASTEPSSL